MSDFEETMDPTVPENNNTDKLPTDSAGNVKAIDFGSQNSGAVDTDKHIDFGDKLLTGYDTAESISNTYGKDAKLGSSESYWDNEEIRNGFIENYGEKNAKENFDMVYKNLEGEYSKYLQDNFSTDSIMDNMVKVSYSGKVNEAKKYTPVVRSVMKTMDGSIQYGNKYYGAERSDREAMTQKVRLITGEDANGNPEFELFDLTDDLRIQLEESEGFEGFAYNNLKRSMGEHSRGVGFVDIITDGEVWDDVAGDKVDVKNDQIVSNWDIDDGSVLHSLLKGNGLAMEGINYAKILARSPLNTAIEFLDIVPQVGRGIIGVIAGEDAKNNAAYRSLTSMGIQLKGYKTSMSDQALQAGFFGSAEMFLSTTADVASQLILAGGLGKIAAGAVGKTAKGLNAMGATGAGTRLGLGVGEVVGTSTRLALTMMASKDMYQEALEHGFTEREAGMAMGATVWAMWKANSFSGYLTEGIEPSATKYYSKQLATKMMDDAAGAIKKGYVRQITAEGWMARMGKAGSTLGRMLKFADKKMKTDMNWHAAMSEASEEVFEELSSEGVRQMMNGYRALRGDDLTQIAVGKGRFKSYFDPGYWNELKEQLLVSGIAGGIGGVVGKVLHGNAKLTGLTDDSTMLDFILAGQGDVLTSQIYQAAKNNVYGPPKMTTERDDATGAYITGENRGKTMNDTMKEALLQDITVLQTFVDEMGLGNVKAMMDGDPLLKANINETSLLSDVKIMATDLRALLDKTGVGVKTLTALEDTDIQEALVLANDDSAKYRDKLNRELEGFKEELEVLNQLKQTLDQSDAEKAAQEAESAEEGAAPKEGDKAPSFTPEQQVQVDAMTAKIAEQDAVINAIDETVSKEDLKAIQELVVQVRGIKNGSAAETYYMQHTFSQDPMFGSIQNRDPEYVKYGKDFFGKTLRNARDTMSKINKKRVNAVKIGQDNDKRLTGITENNLDKFEDIFESRPNMSSESYQHLLDVRDQIKDSNEVAQLVKDYFNSPDFINKSISAAVAPFSDSEFKDVSDDSRTDDQKIVDTLHQPGKAVWVMPSTGKKTITSDGKHIDFDDYFSGDAAVAEALEAGDTAKAESVIIEAWQKAVALSAQEGKTLLSNSPIVMRLANEGKIELDAAIGTDNGEEFSARAEERGDVDNVDQIFNTTLSVLNSFNGSILYTKEFLGNLEPTKKEEDTPKDLRDTKYSVSKDLISFVKGEQFKRIYTKLVKDFTKQVNIAEELMLPVITLDDDYSDELKEIMESEDFTGADEDFYPLFNYDGDFIEEIDGGNVFSEGGLINLTSPVTVADALRATPQAQNLQKEYQQVLNSDDRLQKIKKFIGTVTDPNASENEKDVFNQENIDPEIPSLYSPFQLDWMRMELSGGIGQDFVTTDSEVLRKVGSIRENLKESEDGKSFEMQESVRQELKQAQEAIQIRQNQRDLLRHLMVAPPLPNMPSPLERIAGFRDNIYKILEDKPYPFSARFSQEEQHNYKNHSTVSDFINDFIYDPRVILDIEKRYVAEEPITKAEKDLYVDYKVFIGNLAPITNNDKARKSDEEPILDMEKDIIDVQGLDKGIMFMTETASLEQGLEILSGIDFLLTEFPADKADGGIEAREALSLRHKSVKSRFKSFQHNIISFVYNYEGISTELPEELVELNEFALSWKGDDTITDDDYVKLEKMMHKFYKVLPKVREDLGDSFFNHYGNTGKKNPELKFFSEYDVDNFYTHYLNYLDTAMSSDGLVPSHAQEMNAMFINAFINTEGELRSTKEPAGGFNSSMLLAISGAAGGGKTHVVSKLGLDLAQRQQSKVFGEEKTKVMVASNHEKQVTNIKGALDKANIALSGEGKRFDQLIGTLKDYISGKGGPSVTSEIDSTSVIVYDEYSGINAKALENLAPGEDSIHSLVDLIRQVNKSKPEGTPAIKLVVLGDKAQTDYSDDTGIESSFRDFVHYNAHFEGIEMTDNFRSSNIYLTEGLNKFKASLGIAEAVFNKDYKHEEYSRLYFAPQSKFGGRLMGIQSVTKPFSDIMGDASLALNIKTQIDLAKKEGRDFTVGIIPDDISILPMESPVGKLISEYADHFTVVSSEEVMQRIRTREVQGLEFNYVLTEFSMDYIGDPAVLTEDTNLHKKQYTLASRARDFVVIANNNNSKIVSTKTNEQLIVLNDSEKADSRKLPYDHIKKVFDEITPTESKRDAKGEEVNVNPEVDVELDIEVDFNLEISTKLDSTINQKVTELVVDFPKYDTKTLDRTFRILYKMTPTERANAYESDSSHPDMSEEDSKWVSDNSVQLERVLAEIRAVETAERKRIDGIIDTVIYDANPEYGEMNDEEIKTFTEKIIKDIADNNPDINVASEYVKTSIEDRLKTHIETANSTKVDPNTEDEIDEEIEDSNEDSHSNNVVPEPTPEKVKRDYKEKINHYGSFQAMRLRADELGKKVANDEATAAEIDEFNTLLRSLEQFFKRGIAPQPKIEHDFKPKEGDDADGELKLNPEEKVETITGVTDSDIFNMKKNQAKNGASIQILNLREEVQIPDGATKAKKEEIIKKNKANAKKRIAAVKLAEDAGYTDVSTSSQDIHDAMHYGEALTELAFVGGKDSNGYEIGLIIATTAKGKSVILGRLIFGFPLRKGDSGALESQIPYLQRNAKTINEAVGLVGDGEGITSGSDYDELESKLYPTNYRLKQIIKGAKGAIVKQTIPVKDIKKLLSAGSGAPIRRNNYKDKVSFDTFMKEMAIDANVQVSPHIIINKGKAFKGVVSGGAFVLYTTNPYIQLDDLQTVLDLLETRDTETGALSLRNGSKIKTDVGLIPLDPGVATLEDMYKQSLRKDLSAKATKTTQHLVYNDMLTGTGNNNKIAKVMYELSVHLLSEPELAKSITPQVIKDQQKVEGKDHYLDIEVVKNLISGLTRVSYITEQGNMRSTLEGDPKKTFFNNLTPKKDATLSKEDIISAIFTPFIRNVRSPSSDKEFAGEASLYTLLNGKEYEANSTAMFGETVNDLGDTVQNFNTIDMLAAIAKEIRVRLMDKGTSSADLDGEVDTYMSKLILPMLSDIFAKSSYFSKYAVSSATATEAESGFATTHKAMFSTSAVGETGYFKDSQGSAVPATARFRPSKDNSANGLFVSTNLLGIEYPHMKLLGAKLLKALSVHEPIKPAVKPEPVVDIAKNIMTEVNRAYDKLESDLATASTEEDLAALEAGLSIQSAYIGEALVMGDKTIPRWDALTEANRLSITTRSNAMHQGIKDLKAKLAKQEDVVAVYVEPFTSAVDFDTLKKGKISFDAMVDLVQKQYDAVVKTVNTSVTDKGTKVDILDGLTVELNKALGAIDKNRTEMSDRLKADAAIMQKILNEYVTYTDKDKAKALINIGFAKNKIKSISPFLNTSALATMVNRAEAAVKGTSTPAELYTDPTVTEFSISPAGTVVSLNIPLSDDTVRTVTIDLVTGTAVDQDNTSVKIDDLALYMSPDAYDAMTNWVSLSDSDQGLGRDNGTLYESEVKAINDLKASMKGIKDTAPFDFKEILPKQRKIVDIKDILGTFSGLTDADAMSINASLNSLNKTDMDNAVQALTAIKADKQSINDNVVKLRPLLAALQQDLAKNPNKLKALQGRFLAAITNC